ncbi:MAG: radical SAM family heme chaperone HemW [Acidobacteriia bacterium]|nr:radical SAM family heme chaperone HemW [Terriglobia bacterium]
MSLGLYVSVPFCRTKCSYCNFASDVFSRAVFERYVERVAADITQAGEIAEQMGGLFENSVDSIFLGGGTPTILDIAQLARLFVTISQTFVVESDAEITVECAPGTLTPAMIEAFQRCGVNRVSLGVQSFVDKEAAAVGRQHKRAAVLEDVAHLRASGIENINIDLIAGLPHQTPQSWEFSVAEAVALGAPHVSVYMLEVDDDSRLGRELMAGGSKYHAHFVPNDELTADFYETACQRLNAAGVCQYEISNFARPGMESRHNLKYWTRQPYLGFGVDAHSMLRGSGKGEPVRFSTPDSLEEYVAGAPLKRIPVSKTAALEETFFLGLRLAAGVDLKNVAADFGQSEVHRFTETISEFVDLGLLECEGDVIRLTGRGRLLSNEVFERFILCGADTPVRRL